MVISGVQGPPLYYTLSLLSPLSFSLAPLGLIHFLISGFRISHSLVYADILWSRHAILASSPKDVCAGGYI